MRAFILGNSGELLDHDLSKLEGEVVFGVNALPLREPKIITHYVCLDILMAFVPEVRKLVSSDCKKYYSRLMWNAIYEEEGVEVYDTQKDGAVGFEISHRNVYPGGSCIYVALQIAASLGFDEIYLLGVDLGAPANGVMHIPEQDMMMRMVREKNLSNPSIDKRFNNLSHEELKQVMSKRFIFANSVLKDRGVKVINLSKGGNLNCFERGNYEELLSKEKSYV